MAYNADQVIETFSVATEENQMSPLREFQVVTLPAEGELWVAGDIHDHRRNFDKLLRLADLAHNPQRHILLQEIIHGDYTDATGADLSWQTLLRAAEHKCDFPGQVHFILANHDLAQIHGEGIMKGGASVCEAFTRALKNEFAQRADVVNVAICEFFLSLPLAVRLPGGIFCCHSTPTDAQLANFDYTIFGRELAGPDYQRKVGPVYQLIWGRHTSAQGAAQFADAVEAQILITGHQPQQNGYAANGERHLIIASDHNQGVFLPLDLSQTYDIDALQSCIKRFVAVEA